MNTNNSNSLINKKNLTTEDHRYHRITRRDTSRSRNICAEWQIATLYIVHTVHFSLELPYTV